MAPQQEERKYIVGWLTCRPGKRDELMKLLVPYAADCRTEAGCIFFEMNPSVTDPDMVTLAECFASERAHEIHCEREVFRPMWTQLHDYCLSGRFENVYPGRVVPDAADFTVAPRR